MTTYETLWTVEEVAQYLEVSVHAVYRMTCRKAKRPIPHFKLGGRLRFQKARIDEWLALHEVSSLERLKKARRLAQGG